MTRNAASVSTRRCPDCQGGRTDDGAKACDTCNGVGAIEGTDGAQPQNHREEFFMTTAELLAEIRQAIESVETWKPQHSGDLAANGAMAYEGDAPDDNGGWRILIVCWPIETKDETPQCATVVRWGNDGTATRAPLMVRLTPELAELAGKRAQRRV